MIRLIITLLYLAFFGLISLPMLLIEWIIGKRSPEARVRSSQAFVCWGFRCVGRLAGARLTVKGLEKVPADTAVCYIANHRSFFDIVLTYPLVKNNTGYLAKKQTAKVPILSNWMRIINCQFLDRDDIRQGLTIIKRCIELVKEGTSIFIFPEGTRAHGEEMLPFKEGSLKVAERGGCPVIPVAISNTDAILEKHFPLLKAAPVTIEFGDPIDLSALGREEKKHSGAYVQQIIAGMLAEHANS